MVVRPMVFSVSGASSPQVTSRTRCRRFPLGRWARAALAKAAAETCGEKRQYRAQQMVFALRTTLAVTRAMVPRPGIGGTGGHHLKRTLPGRKGVATSCHPAAAGGGTRRAITRRLSKLSSCARDSRSTPSLDLRAGEFAWFRHLVGQHHPGTVPQQDLQFVPRLARNTAVARECGSIFCSD